MITAQVVLINPEGLVLGVSRKHDHNDFGLCGGKMEDIDNDDPIITAIRETKEETGLVIFDLQLVFAIHKDGYMGYTYLAKYLGEINHNEPHIVRWLPFEKLILGSFGKYNQLVSESLDDMGVSYIKIAPPKDKYLYAFDDKNFIHLTSKTHWLNNKTKKSVLSGIALDDIYAICENNGIMLHDIVGDKIERFIMSRKNNVEFNDNKEVEIQLKKCGFLKNKEFNLHINK